VPQQLDDLPYADVLSRHEGQLEPRGEYDVTHFDELVFEDADIGNAQFMECAFTSVTFSAGSFRRARFNDVWFSATRIVGTDLAETSWLDAAVVSSGLSGVEAFSVKLRRVTFTRCKLDSVNLRSARLDGVAFDECLLNDVDFGGATLNDVRFPGSTLRGVRMAQASLDKADFRGAAELGLKDGYDSLRGAIVDYTQLVEIAPALATSMGITLSDEQTQ
jgi:uncharacterized protein YjbI with pentapeptide repeats